MIGRHDRNSLPITPWRLRDEHTTMCTLEQAKTISRDAWYLSRLRCIYSMSLPAFLCHNRWVSTTERTRRKSRTYHDASLRGAHIRPYIRIGKKEEQQQPAATHRRSDQTIQLSYTLPPSSRQNRSSIGKKITRPNSSPRNAMAPAGRTCYHGVH